MPVVIGTSCNPFFTGGDVAYPQDLDIDPSNPLKLYSINGQRLFKTTDAGSTWNNSNLKFEVASLTIDPGNPSVLYAAPYPATKIYRSTDGGNSWASIIESQAGFAGGLVVNPSDSSTLYLGTRQGVLKSVDGGINWAGTAFPVISASRLTFDPATPSTIYAIDGFGKRTDTPWIQALYREGKRLTVRGESFDAGAKILLDGEEQKTKNSDPEPASVLIGKKAGKQVKRHPGTTIQVRNSNGKLSQEVTFFPPNE